MNAHTPAASKSQDNKKTKIAERIKGKGSIVVNTHLKVLVSAGIVFCLFSSVFGYSGGSGTEADPYQIGTVADWNDLMNTPSDWDANFIMTADINLQGVPLIPVGNDINETYIPFEGVFDGNGHVIRNAAINMPGQWHIGLFGIIDSNSQIRNLGVEDCNMVGGNRVAGLVACSFGTISNCYATGKVSFGGGPNLGGLVGKNYGTITGSHAACDVNGGSRLGGLVGSNFEGTITACHATGTVSGEMSAGGLVGENFEGTITNCSATGMVSGGVTGGLVGQNYGPITNCYATGMVSGGVTGTGGLVGNSWGNITNCYSTGLVCGTSFLGGLIGYNYNSTVINSFWDIETSGQTTSTGGTGLTTAEMMTLSTFTSAGWDFVDTWGIGENQTYPFLRTFSGADLNYDGLVNLNDFALFADRWLVGG